MKTEFVCGQKLNAPYPFIRTTYEARPDDIDSLPVDRPTWRPGVEHDYVDEYSSRTFADANGEVEYTVIAVFKPGRFPSRVFYTRTWVDPDGKRFGKQKLHITTVQHFKTLIKGYRHEYEMSDLELP